MNPDTENNCIAFAGSTLIASGSLADVAAAAKPIVDAGVEPVLVFDAKTSRPVEIDFRGSVDDVVARLAPQPQAPRPPGRPKLGVVSREVTLLPRHWEWLAAQPGGASVTLRKLVENARRDAGGEQQAREAADATYRFALAIAGNEPGFEEATRALYAGDAARFTELVSAWPVDVAAHARRLASGAFGDTSGG